MSSSSFVPKFVFILALTPYAELAVYTLQPPRRSGPDNKHKESTQFSMTKYIYSLYHKRRVKKTN